MGRARLLELGRFALLLLLVIAVQTVLTARFTVFGVSADLFLILTVVVALTRGPLPGAVFGFCAGLIADVVFIEPVGLKALIYLLTGYFVGMVIVRLPTASPWAVVLLTGVSSLAAQIVYGIFQYVIGPQGAFLTMVAIQILPASLLNALLAAPVYAILVRIRLLPAPGASIPSFR